MAPHCIKDFRVPVTSVILHALLCAQWSVETCSSLAPDFALSNAFCVDGSAAWNSLTFEPHQQSLLSKLVLELIRF